MVSEAARKSELESRLLSIGQVLARLRTDYPDLSSSKLRFLEERGLIHPARTASGYRKFSSEDVERLRLVLSMQRDHYLPLKVIRSYLAELDAGRSPAFPGLADSPSQQSIISERRRLKRDELLTEAGADGKLLSDAVSASLIVPGESFGEDALCMLKALVSLRSVGIEPRHLRGFRMAASREVDLIQSALLPMVKKSDSASRARATEMAGEIASHLETVRTMLIRIALDRWES